MGFSQNHRPNDRAVPREIQKDQAISFQWQVGYSKPPGIQIWMFPKIGGEIPPNHPMFLIGFSIINYNPSILGNTTILGNTQILFQDCHGFVLLQQK